MHYRQDPPYAVQIEMTQGCPLRCPFCGINGIKTEKRTYEFMSVDTARVIAVSLERAGWNPRIEFAMHGEPTRNPEALAIIRILRAHLPRSYFLMETNGSGFLGASVPQMQVKIAQYFEAGMDTIALDEYQRVPWAAQVRPAARQLRKAGVAFYEYPREPEGSPHTRTVERRFVIIAPIDTAVKGTHSHLNNHCGAGAPLSLTAAGKRCAKPFRELAIRWDGNVAICCNDWNSEYRVGNILTTDLAELWQSPRFNAARRKLIRGERTFTPCLGCTADSYRVGLLPDKKGLVKLDPPDAACERIIKEATVDGPLVPFVDRGWSRDREQLVRIQASKRLV